jgi:hypothetical protein
MCLMCHSDTGKRWDSECRDRFKRIIYESDEEKTVASLRSLHRTSKG